MKRKKIKVEDTYVKRAYVSPSAIGAFMGIARFAKARKIKDLQAVEKSLQKIDTYTLHKPVRTKLKRRPVIVKNPGILQLDLIDLSKIKSRNKNTAFALAGIDVFTKFAAVIPTKTKSAPDMVVAIKQLLEKFKGKITAIQTDFGNEFYASKVQNLFKARGIHHYSSYSPLKAQTVSVLYKFRNSQNTYEYNISIFLFIRRWNGF